MVSAFYFLGSKQKFGRSPGSGLGSEADSFLWNQDNAYTDGGLPGGLWKLQVDHTFSPNLFVSLKGMYYDTGFTLAPRGDVELVLHARLDRRPGDRHLLHLPRRASAEEPDR